jgi:hypothetical protein
MYSIKLVSLFLLFCFCFVFVSVLWTPGLKDIACNGFESLGSLRIASRSGHLPAQPKSPVHIVQETPQWNALFMRRYKP